MEENFITHDCGELFLALQNIISNSFYLQRQPICLGTRKYVDFYGDEPQLQIISNSCLALLKITSFAHMLDYDTDLVNGDFAFMQSVAMGEAFSALSRDCVNNFDPLIVKEFRNLRTKLCHTERRDNLRLLHTIVVEQVSMQDVLGIPDLEEKLREVEEIAQQLLRTTYGYNVSVSVSDSPGVDSALPVVGAYISSEDVVIEEGSVRALPVLAPEIVHRHVRCASINFEHRVRHTSYLNQTGKFSIQTTFTQRAPEDILAIEDIELKWFEECHSKANDNSDLVDLAQCLFVYRDKYFRCKDSVLAHDVVFCNKYSIIREAFFGRIQRNRRFDILCFYMTVFAEDATVAENDDTRFWKQKFDELMRDLMRIFLSSREITIVNRISNFLRPYWESGFEYLYKKNAREPGDFFAQKFVRGSLRFPTSQTDGLSESIEDLDESHLRRALFQMGLLNFLHRRSRMVFQFWERRKVGVLTSSYDDDTKAAWYSDIRLLSNAHKNWLQIITGNLARSLLENPMFISHADAVFMRILSHVFACQRGLSAHNQILLPGYRTEQMEQINPLDAEEGSEIYVGRVLRPAPFGEKMTVILEKHPRWPSVTKFGDDLTGFRLTLFALNDKIQMLQAADRVDAEEEELGSVSPNLV